MLAGEICGTPPSFRIGIETALAPELNSPMYTAVVSSCAALRAFADVGLRRPVAGLRRRVVQRRVLDLDVAGLVARLLERELGAVHDGRRLVARGALEREGRVDGDVLPAAAVVVAAAARRCRRRHRTRLRRAQARPMRQPVAAIHLDCKEPLLMRLVFGRRFYARSVHACNSLVPRSAEVRGLAHPRVGTGAALRRRRGARPAGTAAGRAPLRRAATSTIAIRNASNEFIRPTCPRARPR